MFTGIIEEAGEVLRTEREGGNIRLLIRSKISSQLRIDQSVNHNGVCLTVTGVEADAHWVTAIDETLRKSTIGSWKEGTVINLERSMLNQGRFDGHIVQGHVDEVGKLLTVSDQNGSWLLKISYNAQSENVTVEKGSIAVDGISLTCFASGDGSFTVAIIPYTWEHTNLRFLRPGSSVNLEFDIIGKYVRRLMEKTR